MQLDCRTDRTTVEEGDEEAKLLGVTFSTDWSCLHAHADSVQFSWKLPLHMILQEMFLHKRKKKLLTELPGRTEIKKSEHQ